MDSNSTLNEVLTLILTIHDEGYDTMFRTLGSINEQECVDFRKIILLISSNGSGVPDPNICSLISQFHNIKDQIYFI